MRRSVSTWLFLASLAWGVSIFWIAPHPPMVDLPQHAGQISLLRDLVRGVSPWDAMVRVNLLTPYLTGDLLACLLSFAMPVAAAVKVVLSLAYLAFVLALVSLRKHFGADPRMDWLFLLPFFGFSYAWGLFPFLVSAPVTIWFILAADRYFERPSPARGLVTTLLGLLLLVSHGLAFVFGGMVVACLSWLRGRSLRHWMLNLLPLLLPALAALALFVNSTSLQQDYGGIEHVGPVVWDINWKRIPKILVYSFDSEVNPLACMASIALLIAPWLLGLTATRQREAWVLFIVTVSALLVVPAFAMATGMLYMRFALFAFPAYALLFAGSSPPVRARTPVALPMIIAVSWLILGYNSLLAWRFAREAADFDVVLSAMQPAQRAISLSFAQDSAAAGNEYAYRHYAAWYESEKQGWIDFNFAWFPEEIVRFRPDRLPAISYDFDVRPAGFDWKKHRGDSYRYIVVRHVQPLPATLFDGAECIPHKLAASGAWTVFETCRR